MQGLKTIKHPARWIVPTSLVMFCGVVIAISTTFEDMPPILKRGIQPSDFPQLIAGLIIFLVMIMVWREPVRVSEIIGKTTWGTFGLIGLFVVLMPVDFFLALGVFSMGLATLWGERRPAFIALVGALIPFLVFLLFDQIFEIRFPRGFLTNLWYGF